MDEEEPKEISRRKFLKDGLTLSAGAALGTTTLGKNFLTKNSDAKKRKKPNILFIINDEFTPDVSGPYGNHLVQTPTLDKLASEGVTFDNCYTNCPLCTPSRLSLISGKYLSRTGVWGLNSWLPSNNYPTIAPILQKEGYDTVLSGKMHFDKTRNYGFKEIFKGWEDKHHKNGLVPRRAPDDTNIDYKRWKNRSSSFHPGDHSPHILGHDQKVTKIAGRYIQSRSTDDKPFFMIAGYLAPHFPLIFPKEYYQLYKGKLGLPEIPRGEIPMQPRNYQQIRRAFGFVNMGRDIQIKGREMYYAGVSWADHQIGQLLKVLYNSEVADNTIVIFTSDHGANIGRHGMWWKNNMYDSAARIPLIIRYPKRWKGGQRRKKVCSLLDVTQTILELAGTEAPSDWNGDSMLPWLDNKNYSWKDFAVSQYYANFTSSGFTMFRSRNYKYVYHAKPLWDYPRERQFYDMTGSGKEFVDLKNVPDYQQKMKTFHHRMVKEIGEDPDDTEVRCFREIEKPYKGRD